MVAQQTALLMMRPSLALPALPAEESCSRTPLHAFIERGQDLSSRWSKNPRHATYKARRGAGRMGADQRQCGSSPNSCWNRKSRGRLTFHQHVPTEIDTPFDPAAYERRMGAPLRELARRGLLIVLSGNAHSRMAPLPMPSPLSQNQTA